MKLERIQTSDGSHTYINTALDISYRSVYGAKTESNHVFIEGTNLPNSSQECWSVLELGFGTGMNLSTTYAFTKEKNIKLEYYSLEPALMPIDELLIDEDIRLQIKNRMVETADLRLHIINSKWEDWKVEKEFDAYYHDPFDPKISPNCWTQSCFEWALSHIKPTGLLATYCAASKARKAMYEAGFTVAKRKGAGRKREMTIAAKTASLLQGLKILNLHTK